MSEFNTMSSACVGAVKKCSPIFIPALDSQSNTIKSSIKMEKKKGDYKLPCLEPCSSGTQFDSSVLYRTLLFIFLNIFEISRISWKFRPWRLSLYRSPLIQTRSKAFSASMKHEKRELPFSLQYSAHSCCIKITILLLFPF